MARMASVATGDTMVLIDNLFMRVWTLPPIGANAWLVASRNETPRAYIILPKINALQIIIGYDCCRELKRRYKIHPMDTSGLDCSCRSQNEYFLRLQFFFFKSAKQTYAREDLCPLGFGVPKFRNRDLK